MKELESVIHDSKAGETLRQCYLFKGKNGIGHDEEMYNAEVEELATAILKLIISKLPEEKIDMDDKLGRCGDLTFQTIGYNAYRAEVLKKLNGGVPSQP